MSGSAERRQIILSFAFRKLPISWKYNLWATGWWRLLSTFRHNTGALEETDWIRDFKREIITGRKRKKYYTRGAKIQKQTTKACSTPMHRLKNEPKDHLKVCKVWSQCQQTSLYENHLNILKACAEQRNFGEDPQPLREKSIFFPPTNNWEQDICLELIRLVSGMTYKASNI